MRTVGFKRGLAATASSLGILLGAAVADAGQITQADAVPDTPTDFTSGATFKQFDPANGTLTGVGVTVTGDVAGSVTYQSKELAPSALNAAFSGVVTVARPDSSQLVSSFPSAGVSANLGAAGTPSASGTLAASGSDREASGGGALSAADRSLFTGLGTVTLPVTAQVRAQESGPANLTATFQAKAGASVGLTYNFTAPGTMTSTTAGGVSLRPASWARLFPSPARAPRRRKRRASPIKPRAGRTRFASSNSTRASARCSASTSR